MNQRSILKKLNYLSVKPKRILILGDVSEIKNFVYEMGIIARPKLKRNQYISDPDEIAIIEEEKSQKKTMVPALEKILLLPTENPKYEFIYFCKKKC